MPVDTNESSARLTGGSATVVLLLVFAAVSFWSLRAPVFELPLTRDEGEYAYIAQRWAAGDLPYRDAFDQKPPAVFVAYRAAFAVAGESVAAVRGLHSIWVALTALVVFLLARRVGGPLAAGFAALTYVVAVSTRGWFGHVANTEVFMLLPMAASAWFLVRACDEDRATDWIVCGACAMAAFWFKQVAATSGLWVVLAVLVFSWREGWEEVHRRLARRALLLILGAAAISALVVWPFARASAMDAFLDAVFVHNVAYVQSVDVGEGMDVLKSALAGQAPEFAAIWGLAILAVVARRRDARPYAWWLVFCFFGVCAGFYFRPHYFMELGPALAILAGLGAATLVGWLARFKVPALVGAAGLAAAIAVPPRVANAELLAADTVEISRRIHDVNPFVEAPRLAERIRAGSDEDDTIYVFGSEPEIFFYAGRRSATRYIFTYPLLGDFADVGARQREAMTEVRAASPKWIVVVSIATSHLEAPGVDQHLTTETLKLINEGYVLDSIAVMTDKKAAFKIYEGAKAAEVSANVLQQGSGVPAVRLFKR